MFRASMKIAAAFLLTSAALVFVAILSAYLAENIAAARSANISFDRVLPVGFTADDEGNTVMDATCASGGTILTDADGNTQNLTEGLHWVSCTVEDCFFCEAGACASPDGIRFPAGFAGVWYVKGGAAYCRSVGDAGDLRFSRLEMN